MGLGRDSLTLGSRFFTGFFVESLARGLGDSALPFGGRVPLQASVVSERDEKNACPATTGDIYDYRALHEEALRLLLN